MRTLLTLLMVLGMAGAASAQIVPSAAWIDRFNSNRTVGTLRPGDCAVYSFTALTDSLWLYVGGLDLDIVFEPDTEGDNTTAKAKLWWSAHPDGDGDGTYDEDSGDEFRWDTDADGIVDNSEFDHASNMKKGLAGVRIPGWMGIEATAAPGGSGPAQVMVCAQETD